MKTSLQLNISQHLTLTPQLQQAIRLLQLSTIDLQQEIQLLIESNPMLEITPQDEKEDSCTPEPEEHQLLQQDDEFIDFQWEGQFQKSNKTNYLDENDPNFDNLHCSTANLQDHLHWQLELSTMNDVDRIIATTIIDAINNDGFLITPITELHASLNSEEHPLKLSDIEAIRRYIQLFDPVGCGSTNLIETLLIQLEQLPQSTNHLELAKQIITQDIELLGQRNYKQLMKNYPVDEKKLNEIVRIIQGLNPKPGNLIHEDITEYIIPDLTVKKINNQWKIFLNHNALPHLSINNQYAVLIERANNSADNQYLKNNLQEARWFLKSLQSRQETLFKVAECIMQYQEGFLESGDEAMKPLVLNDIATALDMHESTISRVTTQKFIHTPRGVFELKYFFSSHINTDGGDELSSTAIRALIKKLVAAENRTKPLSDNKITQILEDQGIQVARRTVAKYREAVGIAPSNERKTYA